MKLFRKIFDRIKSIKLSYLRKKATKHYLYVIQDLLEYLEYVREELGFETGEKRTETLRNERNGTKATITFLLTLLYAQGVFLPIEDEFGNLYFDPASYEDSSHES